jgi:predicted metal-binding membrane protein
MFTGAYIAVWVVFSVAATGLQWQLDRWALLSPAVASTSTASATIVLLAAGLYQFTPLKQACLRACRSPLELITRYWSHGPFGIGLRHGIYCVGCCWMLMLVLFVVGVMNVSWVALIAVFALAEKILPRHQYLSYGAGAALLVGAGWMMYVRAFA